MNAQRQREPHAHCIVVSPDNRYAFAADLGTDQVFCYKLDPATAKLTPNDRPFAKSPAGMSERNHDRSVSFSFGDKPRRLTNSPLNRLNACGATVVTRRLAEERAVSQKSSVSSSGRTMDRLTKA